MPAGGKPPWGLSHSTPLLTGEGGDTPHPPAHSTLPSASSSLVRTPGSRRPGGSATRGPYGKPPPFPGTARAAGARAPSPVLSGLASWGRPRSDLREGSAPSARGPSGPAGPGPRCGQLTVFSCLERISTARSSSFTTAGSWRWSQSATVPIISSSAAAATSGHCSSCARRWTESEKAGPEQVSSATWSPGSCSRVRKHASGFGRPSTGASGQLEGHVTGCRSGSRPSSLQVSPGGPLTRGTPGDQGKKHWCLHTEGSVFGCLPMRSMGAGLMWLEGDGKMGKKRRRQFKENCRWFRK